MLQRANKLHLVFEFEAASSTFGERVLGERKFWRTDLLHIWFSLTPVQFNSLEVSSGWFNLRRGYGS
jgi:hypothetical protein